MGLVGSDLKIRINNNRSTMVHVRWKHDATHVSLHHMFVKAPHTIQKALASFIRKQDAEIAPVVHAYIDKHVPALDHSDLIRPEEIVTKGSTYNLQSIYNRLNRSYFGGKLNLLITWYGEPDAKAGAKCTLGMYLDWVKLVKIHKLLDSPKVPLYVIEYVIYHEMVHAVYPIYKDEKGRNRIHSREFKDLEKRFKYFSEAQEWLNKNYKNFFVSKRMKSHGRTQQMGKYQAQKKQGRRRKGQSLYSYF
jgi:predicted metal-dependent hydrolase